MKSGRSVIIRFEEFKSKPKAPYTIILGGEISHFGINSRISIEVSGLCRVYDSIGNIDKIVIPYLEEDLQAILGEINPDNRRKKVNQAKKECTYFAYSVCTNIETKDTTVYRK